MSPVAAQPILCWRCREKIPKYFRYHCFLLWLNHWQDVPFSNPSIGFHMFNLLYHAFYIAVKVFENESDDQTYCLIYFLDDKFKIWSCKMIKANRTNSNLVLLQSASFFQVAEPTFWCRGIQLSQSETQVLSIFTIHRFYREGSGVGWVFHRVLSVFAKMVGGCHYLIQRAFDPLSIDGFTNVCTRRGNLREQHCLYPNSVLFDQKHLRSKRTWRIFTSPFIDSLYWLSTTQNVHRRRKWTLMLGLYCIV